MLGSMGGGREVGAVKSTEGGGNAGAGRVTPLVLLCMCGETLPFGSIPVCGCRG
jgi:hypothetical protein